MFELRPASIEDAAGIARVNALSWKTTYRGQLPDHVLDARIDADRLDRWRAWLARPGDATAYVVEDEGHVVGYASGGRERAGETGYEGELYAIYLLKGHQGRGLGRRLVDAVVRRLREHGIEDMLVWVLAANLGARGFYERLGGLYVRAQPIEIGGSELAEVSYGWTDTAGLLLPR